MMTERGRLTALLLSLFTLGGLVDCQCRTTYDSKVTAECKEAAMKEATRAAPDAGGVGEGIAMDWDKRCRECCYERGLNNVEPGYCQCGTLGLDGLMK